MKIKTLAIVLSSAFLALSLSGCKVVQNAAGNLTPGIFISDLKQEDVEGFITEVIANMEADDKYTMRIESTNGNATFVIDGDNSKMTSTSPEGNLDIYTVDGTTYFNSGGSWIKYASAPEEETLYDEDLLKEELENTTYIRKDECPESQGTCYVFEVKDDEGQVSTLFVNATTKLPVTYEYSIEGDTGVITYDFDANESITLPAEAQDAVSL